MILCLSLALVSLSFDIQPWGKGPDKDSFEQRMGDKALMTIGASMGHPETAPGTVIASPSKKDPDYFFHWTRDAALVMNLFVRLQERMPDEQMEKYIWNYIALETFHQRFTAESGKIARSRLEFQINRLKDKNDEGSKILKKRLEDKLNDSGIEWNLGEPKYNVDVFPYDGGWGRPQHDGPALRALTLIRFANYLLRINREQDARKLYDGKFPSRSIIKVDLEFIAHAWETMSYDLWEETDGYHFYTRLVQYRSLIEGAKLARKLNDPGAADWYETQAKLLKPEIENHYDPKIKLIKPTLENMNQPNKKSDLDAAVILAALHARSSDPADEFFGPSDERILESAQALQTAFADLYPINKDLKATGAVAIGRYPEDTYDGVNTNTRGHAWFLTTSAMAEISFLAAADLEAKDAVANKERIARLRSQGEASLKIIEKFADPQAMDLTEQFDRDTGKPRGAQSLTWSAAAYLTALIAKYHPESR